eukprot:4260515-Lingulodinium_polyedra.AAC.1
MATLKTDALSPVYPKTHPSGRLPTLMAMVKTAGNVYPKTSTVRRFLAIGVPKLFSSMEAG